MTTALAEREAPSVSSEELDLIKRSVANGATDAELKLFLFDCQRRGVHPLDKLLHFTKRGGKYTPVTSIDFMRSQAAMSGEMAGSDDARFEMDGERIVSATVKVYRMTQGQRFPYEATARWSEYCPDNAPMWRRMPHTMLGKCAEALALRKAFPQQLAGLYSREEMDQADASEPVRGAIAAPPETVLDITTGAEVPATARPEPPVGYFYIDGYRLKNGWHEITINHFDSQGGAITLSTKTQAGTVAADAFQQGIPVKVTTKPKPNAKGEAYLQTCEKWHSTPERVGGEMLDASSIPF